MIAARPYDPGFWRERAAAPLAGTLILNNGLAFVTLPTEEKARSVLMEKLRRRLGALALQMTR